MAVRSDPRMRYYDRINVLGSSLPSPGLVDRPRPYSVPRPGGFLSPPTAEDVLLGRRTSPEPIIPSSVDSSPSSKSRSSPGTESIDELSLSLPPWLPPNLHTSTSNESLPSHLSPARQTPTRARSVSVASGEVSRSDPIFIPSRPNFDVPSSSSIASSDTTNDGYTDDDPSFSSGSPLAFEEDLPTPTDRSESFSSSTPAAAAAAAAAATLTIPIATSATTSAAAAALPSSSSSSSSSTSSASSSRTNKSHSSFVPPHLQMGPSDELSGARWEFKKQVERRRR